MTLREKLESMIVNSGMFPDMAKRVMDNVVLDPVNEPMNNRWNDRVDDYPPQLLSICWLSACDHAVKLIDAECPKHWARQVFVSGFGIP